MSRRTWNKETINAFCKENGCRFLSKEYTSGKEKYDFICSCGNEFTKRFNQFVKVPRCANCGHRRGRGIKEHITELQRINESRDDFGIIYQRGDIGGTAIKVDLGDLDFLLQGALWSVNANGYASRHSYTSNGKDLMHRIILNVTDPKIQVDHINGDKLDNRRQNLREATVSQNLANSEVNPNHATSYKGVTTTPYGKYRSRIGFMNERIFIGDFNTEEDAARAYNEKAVELFGEYARINIIREDD